MSLTKKRTLTEKRLAANQANGKRSRGPATAGGRKRIRDANLRHGFYSQDSDTALRALGEKPEDFDAVVKAVMEKYPPASGFEELMAMCLARALWRMERGYRTEEGYALRQAKDVQNMREDRLHAEMMRLKMTAATLQSLAESVAREHYVTTLAEIDLMKGLGEEGAVKEMGKIAVGLFYLLREPGAPGPGEPEEGEDSETDEDSKTFEDAEAEARKVVAEVRGIFGLSPDLHPEAEAALAAYKRQRERQQVPPQDADGVAGTPAIGDADTSGQGAAATGAEEEGLQLTAEEWESRERVRQLLENILNRQVVLCEAQRTANLRECVAGPSPFERAAEIAPTHPSARLMRRMQDSNFREVWRITQLLQKIQNAGQQENREISSRPLNVHENSAG